VWVRWQFGFFNADGRLAAITAKGDPLEMIARVVPFESFREEMEAAVLTPVSEKSSAIALQSFGRAGRVSSARPPAFTRFLRLGFEDSIPDDTTLWLFRETLAKAGLIERTIFP
jgi:IS5 family transposase